MFFARSDAFSCDAVADASAARARLSHALATSRNSFRPDGQNLDISVSASFACRLYSSAFFTPDLQADPDYGSDWRGRLFASCRKREKVPRASVLEPSPDGIQEDREAENQPTRCGEAVWVAGRANRRSRCVASVT